MMFLDKTRWLIVREADPDFACFQQALEEVKMPGETPQYLLAASLKALKQTKRFMEKGHREGAESERLIQLLRSTHSTHDNCQGKSFLENLSNRLSRGGVTFEYLTKFSWKMTALSLIQVLLELEGGRAAHVLDAYSQACVFLDLLDNISGSGSEKTADKHFEDIKKEMRIKASEIVTVEQARPKVESLRLRASERATSFDPNDSADWWDIATNNSLEKVCTVILEDDRNPDINMMNKVRGLLADMLHIALIEEVGKELVKKCREWAGMLEDEKIRASVYIAGKLSGVIEELN